MFDDLTCKRVNLDFNDPDIARLNDKDLNIFQCSGANVELRAEFFSSANMMDISVLSGADANTRFSRQGDKDFVITENGKGITGIKDADSSTSQKISAMTEAVLKASKGK